MAHTYVHEPLTSPSHIRILKLLPAEPSAPISALLHQVKLPNDDDDNYDDGSGSSIATPVYTALSYTWGPDIERDKSPMWLDGEQFLVRPNLLAALQTLRRPQETVTLWVDAVCIDQKNVFERNQQVRRMGLIYRSAKKVKVWLGNSGVPSDAREAMEYIQSYECEQELHSGSDDYVCASRAVPIEAMEALLKLNYWSRVWIIQEVMLAAHIDVHYGSLTARWDSLVQVCQPLRQRFPALSSIDLIDQRTALVEGQRPLLAQTLELLIKTHHGAECSERRDRIFAFLSLASDCASGHGLKPNYLTPRLALLVQVLEFCKPTGPIDFISTLFRALTHETRDTAWKNVAQHWFDASRGLPVSNSKIAMVGSASNDTQIISITHLVTASSTTRDWARCYSFEAVLDRQTVNHSAKVDAIEVAQMIENRMEAALSLRYEDRVCKLDDAQTGVLLHERHFVVFSTSWMMAAASPCEVLHLHGREESCSFAQCGLLRKY